MWTFIEQHACMQEEMIICYKDRYGSNTAYYFVRNYDYTYNEIYVSCGYIL
jgi:hypothetical protein